MERKSPFKRAKTIEEEKKAATFAPHKSIKHQHAARRNPSLLDQFKVPEKIVEQATVAEESPFDDDDDLDDCPQTQPLTVDVDADETLSEEEEEESDDEGDFRSLAHDVIQKNGFRTVQKWFDLEAEPFKPKRKTVVSSK